MPEETLIEAALAGDKTPPASGDPTKESSKEFVTQSALDEALERVATQVHGAGVDPDQSGGVWRSPW